MTDLLNTLILSVRIITIIPIIAFAIMQLKHFGRDNGMVWQVRKMTLLLCSAIILLLGNLIFTRIMVMQGHSILEPRISLGILITNIVLLVCVVWAFVEVLVIKRKDK